MRSIKAWALVTSMIGIFFGAEVSAQNITETRTSNPLEISQSIVGQCRSTNRRVDIYSQASVAPASRSLITVPPNGRVVLAGGGANGWIQVSSPAQGYVIARYLKPCTDTDNDNATNPNPPENNNQQSCRVATTNLVIRPRPVAGSLPVVGGIVSGEAMTITGQTNTDGEGRTWYQISKPKSGWISGSRGGGTNLRDCPN